MSDRNDANWVKVGTYSTLFAANSDAGLLTSMKIPNAVRRYETSPINEWDVWVPREFEVDARQAVESAAALTVEALREPPSLDPREEVPPEDYHPKTPAQMRDAARARARSQSSVIAITALLMFLMTASLFVISVIDLRRRGNTLVCDALHCFGSLELPIGGAFLTLLCLLGLIGSVIQWKRCHGGPDVPTQTKAPAP